MYNFWEENAEYIKDRCGSDFVDYDERYYFCPECGEPIYECEWTSKELEESWCPICEFEWEED